MEQLSVNGKMLNCRTIQPSDVQKNWLEVAKLERWQKKAIEEIFNEGVGLKKLERS